MHVLKVKSHQNEMLKLSTETSSITITTMLPLFVSSVPLSQLSMLSEVRSLVAPQDLEIFDRLVLHREREAHQSWHAGLGVLHPHGLHGHTTVPGSQDGGAATPAVVGCQIWL